MKNTAKQWLYSLAIEYRRLASVGIHVALIALCNYLAFLLRFDGAIPAAEKAVMIEMMPWLIVIRGLIFAPFRLYQGLWRYSGIWDLRNLIAGVGLSSVVVVGFIYFVYGAYFGYEINHYPRSIVILDTLLLIFSMGGVRMVRRLYQAMWSARPNGRVLIYGAGNAGEVIVRDMRNNAAFYKYRPVGFVDDDPRKIGQRIHGVPVLGDRRRLGQIIDEMKPQEVIIAMPSSEPAIAGEIAKSLRRYNVAVNVLPNTREIQNGRVSLGQVRGVSTDDLLVRKPIGLDLVPVQNLIQGKRVLVTGAAGSIGSELSRQIAGYEPELLVLLDKSENGLFAIDTELGRRHPFLKKSANLVDIKHTVPLREVFKQQSPQIVLHAAAYKHVPMMEFHPGEAVLNNIVGTCRLSQVAIDHGAEKFILISTDKAVNPTNVMGATKRVAEIYIDALECNVRNEQTVFSAVRFGNVLGSAGSVVPLFREQIKNGGPVTVTHPEVTRYFMTIPEAVQLVLRATSLAEGGETFVLDMGKPVKLVDIARDLIQTSGLIPDKDIAISFVGLRPGEKLHEELIGPEESALPTLDNKIFKIRPSRHVTQTSLMERIARMEELAFRGDTKALLEILCEIVPNFHPVGMNGGSH